jgi:type I restriction enzyme M protein
MYEKELVRILGFSPKDKTASVYHKTYASGYIIEIDFENSVINYGKEIKSGSKTTQNFSQPENFVVLECVDRLLAKGYKAKDITLEKVFPSGHGHSGRLDIFVKNGKKAFLMIECKTFGKEFEKEMSSIRKNGGQLFTYFQNDTNTDYLMLYSSCLLKGEIKYKSEIVKIEDSYRTAGNVEDVYNRWNKITNKSGIFEEWIAPYEFQNKLLTKKDLQPLEEADGGFIFNSFASILRKHSVSDKPNAFNKIFNLFLAKIYDEDRPDDEELAFQWMEGKDDSVEFQIRLINLHKAGILHFLEKEIAGISDSDFNAKDAEDLKRLKKERLKFDKIFDIKEVFDDDSFDDNFKVLKEVVQLLEKYQIRYPRRQRHLSDFFERLLTTGLKQEAGQFFTPVPIACFIVRSLPLKAMIETSANRQEGGLPAAIDFAAGSGHFLTEILEIYQTIIDRLDLSRYSPSVKKRFTAWSKDGDPYSWATRYVYGIEKDYRLVKVAKVGCYFYGDGLAQIFYADGLDSFSNSKAYDGLLTQNAKHPQFDIVVSNPPYSVDAFRSDLRNKDAENDFTLYPYLTDKSSEIECLFVERTARLLKEGGIAGIILPSSLLSNAGIYTKTRGLILQKFEIIAITALGSNTFMATGTNTVILFLRRRKDSDTRYIKEGIDAFLESLKDMTIGGIENTVAKYARAVWNVSVADYITLHKKEPNEEITRTALYKEYYKSYPKREIYLNDDMPPAVLDKMKEKYGEAVKKYWEDILALETEKLFYFILAFPQKTVLIKTGEKDAEKRFLGYEFSNRRGFEGIHPIQRGKTIEECTKLFDDEQFDNPEKASTYVYKAFSGDYDYPIHDSLKENITRVRLVDMLAFDRKDFEKAISLVVKTTVKIESKWEEKRIGDVLDLEYGKGLSEKDRITGKYPVVGSNGIVGYHNEYITKGPAIIVGRKGSVGKVTIIQDNCYPIDTTFYVRIKDENLSFSYCAIMLKFVQDALEALNSGSGPGGLNRNDAYNLQIPFPPPGIQEKIVTEIEALTKQEKNIIDRIALLKSKTEGNFQVLYKKANMVYKLSDRDIFDIFIGKRVLDAELISNGGIPVYSANVFEPFGNIDKYFITDFDVPSVLWGIDGDWMVNHLSANKPFYPTDHCGVLRVKTGEILPGYLAWVLNKEGREKGFSRNLRASINRIQGLSIKVPPLSEQQKIAAEIEKLEDEIQDLQKLQEQTASQKELCLKKYLQ